MNVFISSHSGFCLKNVHVLQLPIMVFISLTILNKKVNTTVFAPLTTLGKHEKPAWNLKPCNSSYII